MVEWSRRGPRGARVDERRRFVGAANRRWGLRRPLVSAGPMERSAAAVAAGTARSRAVAALSRPHNWVQLAQVLPRRRERLRRQPRRLHGAPAGRGRPLPPGRGLLLPGRGHEQLHLEPPVDVPPSARPRRLPGAAFPRRLGDRARREPARPATSSSGWASGRSRPRPSRSSWSRRSTSSATSSGRSGRASLGANLSGMRALAVAALLALLLVPTRGGGATLRRSSLRSASSSARPHLTEKSATAIFLAEHKVASWLERYPEKGRVTDATYDKKSSAWDVKVWWGEAGEIAAGRVDDANGYRPRGLDRPAGGLEDGARLLRRVRRDRDQQHLGLARLLRRLLPRAGQPRAGPLSWRNLDLLALLFFSVSLWYFNDGDIFTSVPLAYPPMFYLAGAAHLDRHAAGRASAGRVRSGRCGCSPPRRSSCSASGSGSTSRRLTA